MPQWRPMDRDVMLAPFRSAPGIQINADISQWYGVTAVNDQYKVHDVHRESVSIYLLTRRCPLLAFAHGFVDTLL